MIVFFLFYRKPKEFIGPFGFGEAPLDGESFRNGIYAARGETKPVTPPSSPAEV